MDLKQHIVEVIISTIFIDLIILQLLYHRFLLRQAKKGRGKRYMLGIYLLTLGVVLTGIGVFLSILPGASSGWIFSIEMIAAVSLFLVIGIPSLILGIFLVNNP